MAKTSVPDYYVFTCPTENCGNTCNFESNPGPTLCTSCGVVTDCTDA